MQRGILGLTAIICGGVSVLTQSVHLGLFAIVLAILAQETTVNVYGVEE